MRRELGCAARLFIRRRLYRRLGFVRLSDYTRERLGVSARTLQAAAWLATRLDALPSVSRAYDRSELSWAQARAICGVASTENAEHWLALARRCTVDELERLAKRTRRPHGVPPDPERIDNEIDDEPAIRWRITCPGRVRALWRRAIELASRVAGEPLAMWQAAEVIAAEGFSGRPSGPSMGERGLIEAIRLARRRSRRSVATDVDAPLPELDAPPRKLEAPLDVALVRAGGSIARPLTDRDDPTVTPKAAPDTSSDTDDPPEPPALADAFSLDARLNEAVRVIRTSEPRIGRLLRVVVDHRLYRMFGYVRFEDYVRERLGISMRKAWALAKVERATSRSDDFGRAYREGRLSWVRALTLLPVLERANAAAWIERAEAVTVRRLCDEVNWVLETRDLSGGEASLAPPPLDSRLAPSVTAAVDRRRESSLEQVSAEECRELSLAPELQIGARSTTTWAVDTSTLAARASAIAAATAADRSAESEVCDADITLIAPASVVALVRDVVDAFARPGAPRWRALESLLLHAVRHWESTPRHHDPVFDRDGWRCTVPACSSRRNLHDHHIEFRSRGGGNTRDNRTAVCAAHHLHGLHDGTIRATGSAPSGIAWELGVRAGAPPLLTYVGDRRCALRASVS